MAQTDPVARTPVDDEISGATGRTVRVRAAVLTLAPAAVVLLMSTSGIGAEHRTFGPWPVLVVLGQSLPLLLLRRAPRSVLVVVAGVTAAQLAAGLPVTNGMMGQAIAAGVVVARTRWPVSLGVPVSVLAASCASAWVGGLPGLPRFTAFTALSLVLAWVLGDAAGRRAEVRRSMEEELARREERTRLRAQVAALEERLRITRDLHDLVGEALDAVVLQAGAARAHLGHPESVRLLAAIEKTGRGVLGELDRFLGYLRSPSAPGDAAATPAQVPVAVPAGHRIPRPFRHPQLTGASPVIGVGLLALVDALSVPEADRPFPAWPVVSAVIVALPLLLRRSRPEAVLAFLVAAISGLTVLGVLIPSGVLGIAVALHAVASRRTRRRSVLDAALACAALVTAAAVVGPQEAAALAGPLLGLAVVALYLGDTARVTREHDESLAQRIADAAGEQQLRERVAVVGERTRLARDLHDSIGHTFSLVVLHAGAARLAATSSAEVQRMSAVVGSIESSARSALEELESLVHSTAERDPEAGPLLPGTEDLHDLVEGVRAAGTTVTVTADPTDDLPRSVQVAILRIAQEALTNVVKHAPGAAATVQVVRDGDVLRLTVHNERGAGSGAVLPSGKRGVTGMRERVLMFHGEFQAGPDGAGGHCVDARIPLPRGESSPAPRAEAVGGPS